MNESKTNHADAVVNVCGNDEDGVGEEKVKFNDSKAHCKDADHDGE